MIKILKKGTRHKVKCDGCGTVLRFDESDIKSELDYNWYVNFIHCPQCGHKIIL